MNYHVALAGDSIFDNLAYVRTGAPAVVDQLRDALPGGSQATLLAVDGDTVTDVVRQLDGLPVDATHLIISAGGNDALGYSAILERKVRSAREVFDELSEIHQRFRLSYRQMLGQVLSRDLPTVVCTVYDQIPMQDEVLRRHIVAALTLFNDCILREAFDKGVPVLDLRSVCDEPQDFSAISPIEPSMKGGEHIAGAIARCIEQHDFNQTASAVYG
jgi:hypothetical protein